MHPRETGPDCPVLTSLADPRFSAQGHDHLYHDLRNGAGTSVGQGRWNIWGRRSSCSESGWCSLRSSKCSPYIYIYMYIYIYGMVVSRGNYPLVICHIAIENGPNRNRNSWFTELFQMGGSFHRFLGLFTMSGSPKIGSLKMTSVNP